MLRKGQISLFIIVGIILLVVIGFVLFIRANTTGIELEGIREQQFLKEQELTVGIDIIEEEVLNTFQQGYLQAAQHGGFLDPTGQIAVGIDNLGIPIDGYTKDVQENNKVIYGRSLPTPFPIKKRVMESIERYVQSETNVKDALKKRGFDVVPSDANLEVDIEIKPSNILLTVVGKWTIKKSKQETTIEKVEVIIPHDISRFYSFLELILIYADVTTLSSIEKRGYIYDGASFDVSIKRDRNDFDEVTVTDNSFTINDKPFQFKFLRQNRPPDASRVTLSKVIYGESKPARIECNQQVDPDEDTLVTITVEGEKYQCGSPVSSSDLGITGPESVCDKGREITAEDAGGLYDSFSAGINNVRCDVDNTVITGDIIASCCQDTGNGGCFVEVECRTCKELAVVDESSCIPDGKGGRKCDCEEVPTSTTCNSKGECPACPVVPTPSECNP